MRPTSDEIRQVDARLHRLHCNSGHRSNTTLADGLRRDEAPRWVCKRAPDSRVDACESRKPPQPRNRATFEYENKQWSQVGLDCMDLTLESHRTVATVLLMVEVASQMAVTAVLFVRTDGEHRNATGTETTSSFENCVYSTFIQDLLRVVTTLKVVLCRVNGPTRSRFWTSPKIPLPAKTIINLGEVERTLQTLKRAAEKLHEFHLQLSAEQVISRLPSMPNELDRIKDYSGRLHTVDPCGTRRPRAAQIQSRQSKTCKS